jgi:hypothetical protein
MIEYPAAIAKALLLQTFQSKAVIIVPECYWAGDEADLLVVTKDLRIIDIEIKVSRADFRRDAKKQKWWQSHPWAFDHATKTATAPKPPERRLWPRKVWKHYFCMPRDIWTEELLADLPSEACGVLLVRSEKPARPLIVCEKRAKPNRDAERIGAEDVIDIARLSGLRMWSALAEVEAQRRHAYHAGRCQACGMLDAQTGG